MDQAVLYETRGAVAIITINRPERRNSLGAAVRSGIREGFLRFEAVYLSSRIVVMSARPGRIVGGVDVDLPRPRTEETRESEQFFGLVTAVRELLREGGGSIPAFA